MALKIGVVSQKGGVGKSTLARLIACEYARNGWEVKIADMDKGQQTVLNWHRRRLEQNIQPETSVEQYSSVDRALRVENNFDLIVFDGSPRATTVTREIAKVCDLVVLPSGLPLDDLEPTVLLTHDLKAKGVNPDRIAVAFCAIGDSKAELEEARDYLKKGGCYVFRPTIPRRTAYRRASDTGHCLTETRYASLNTKADALVQAIIDRITKLES